MGLQRIGHDWETKKQQQLWIAEWNKIDTWAQDLTQVSREGICVDVCVCVCVCVCVTDREKYIKKNTITTMWSESTQSNL